MLTAETLMIVSSKNQPAYVVVASSAVVSLCPISKTSMYVKSRSPKILLLSRIRCVLVVLHLHQGKVLSLANVSLP